MGNLSTNNVTVYFNDRVVRCCTNLSITADASDNLIYCSFILMEGSDVIRGRGYLERIMEGSFHVRLIDGDDDLSKDYLKRIYM